MVNELPEAAEKIANDYLDRLSDQLAGMPIGDRRELLDEIRSHIYDAYMNENEGSDIDRTLTVLRRLGEPAEVISSRVPKAVENMGKGKKAPLYILAAVLIALLGVPLGLGAVGVLVGLLAALFALVITYYGLGITLVVSGFVSGVVSFIAAVRPDILERINYAFGYEVFSYGPDPQLIGLLGLIVFLIQIGLGLAILWSGKYLWRGFRFVTILITQKVTATFKHIIGSGSPK